MSHFVWCTVHRMKGYSSESVVIMKKTEVKESPVQSLSPTHQADSLLQKSKTFLLMVSSVKSIPLNAINAGSSIFSQGTWGWVVMSTLAGTSHLFSKLVHSHFTKQLPIWLLSCPKTSVSSSVLFIPKK